MDLTQRICCVCENVKSRVSGYLSCGHTFCEACFRTYLNGSLDELRKSLRCCVCGSITYMSPEQKSEKVLLNFGRNTFPTIMHATGLTINAKGDYVLMDQKAKRVYIIDKSGKLINEFPHLYKYEVMNGIIVDREGRIIFPTVTRDSTNVFNSNSYKGLAYYNEKGHSVGFAFLDHSSDIRGLTATVDGNLIATDFAMSKLYFVHKQQRIIFERQIKQDMDESKSPQPWGVAQDDNGIIYVTDVANHCVKVLDSKGYFLFKFGSNGVRAGQFNYPCGITTDDSNRIIVADKHNQRVQIFDSFGKFQRFLVRFSDEENAYMVPVDVQYIGNNHVAVLLCGEKVANVSEVRIYSCNGDPKILSC